MYFQMTSQNGTIFSSTRSAVDNFPPPSSPQIDDDDFSDLRPLSAPNTIISTQLVPVWFALPTA